MTGASRCDRFSDAILDEATQRPEGLDAHVASCPSCAALAAADRAARNLPAPDVARLVPVDEPEIRERVRRRRATRAAGAGALAAGIAALVVFAGPAGRRPHAQPAPDLFALADGLSDLTHRDPFADDLALRGLGPVSDWLAPPRASSLDLHSLAPPHGSRAATGGDAP